MPADVLGRAASPGLALPGTESARKLRGQSRPGSRRCRPGWRRERWSRPHRSGPGRHRVPLTAQPLLSALFLFFLLLTQKSFLRTATQLCSAGALSCSAQGGPDAAAGADFGTGGLAALGTGPRSIHGLAILAAAPRRRQATCVPGPRSRLTRVGARPPSPPPPPWLPAGLRVAAVPPPDNPAAGAGSQRHAVTLLHGQKRLKKKTPPAALNPNSAGAWLQPPAAGRPGAGAGPGPRTRPPGREAPPGLSNLRMVKHEAQSQVRQPMRRLLQSGRGSAGPGRAPRRHGGGRGNGAARLHPTG